MNFSKLWVIDPVTGQPSVSLTLVILSSALLVIAMGLEMPGIISSTSMAFEFFGASCGLYWGRKFTSSKGSALEKE
jgi:hypothetical protein